MINKLKKDILKLEKYDVVIIGAGPIGLACGFEAKKAGLSYIIIDKGCLVNSIYHYPLNMTFFSTSEKLEIGRVPFISHQPKPNRQEALEYYRRVCTTWNLNVSLYNKVTGISPSGSGTSPALAANLAQTVAELYLDGQLETKFEATRRASTWLSERMEQLRVDAEASELAVERFKSAISQNRDPKTLAAKAQTVAAALVTARIVRDEAKDALAQAAKVRAAASARRRAMGKR